MKCNAPSPNIQNSCVTLTLTPPAFLVYVDQIYRTRSDRAYCQNLGIRSTVPPLGRPVLDDLATIRKQTLEDAKVRNQIEGKFGQAKQRFSLNRVMTELGDRYHLFGDESRGAAQGEHLSYANWIMTRGLSPLF